MSAKPSTISKIPFVRPALPSYDVLEADVREIIASGMLTKGRHLAEFERRLAEHLNVKHAIAVSSCTSGLMLAYRALNLKGEVIIPSFTFMATASALVWAGLQPVFADVDLDTTNIDPAAVESAITSRTAAIVAVHNFGNPADIDALERIANKHKVKLLFDAAHGFGASYQGNPVGGQGDVQVFSLSPTKLLVAGEGGVIATNQDAVAEHVRLGREYGNDGNYDSLFAGLNARMPELSAVVGLNALPQLENVVEQRNAQAGQYREELVDAPGLSFIKVKPGNRCSYKDFSILIDEERFGCSRAKLVEMLTDSGIDSRTYYDPAVHQQTAYRKFTKAATLPNTEFLAAGSLSLPMGPHIGSNEISRVCSVIRQSCLSGDTGKPNREDV